MMMTERKRKILAAAFWTLTALLLLMTFYFSAQGGEASQEVSNGVTKGLLGRLFDGMDDYTFFILDAMVRKLAHMAEFALLACFMTTALYFSGDKHPVHAALILTALWGALDEIHQLFVPGRTALVSDVVIDTLGACAGLAVFCFIRYLIRGRRRKLANSAAPNMGAEDAGC